MDQTEGGVVIGSQDRIYAFSPDMRGVRSAPSGTRVVFDVIDALGGQVKRDTDLVEGLDFTRVNPATGPVAVVGATSGDTLAVEIMDIDMDDRGVIVTGHGMGWLGDDIEGYATRILPVAHGEVRFGTLRLPARPMIGVIGVATERDVIPTGTAHRHGGNMDTKEIGVGATVYLPVFQPGALLAMGDVHAVMGDGEICVSACEIGARITTRVGTISGGQPKWPLVHTGSELLILVSLPTVEGRAARSSARRNLLPLRRSRALAD